MHLNLEILECIHLISALLLEVPANAGSIVDPRRSRVSRGLRWLMQRSEFRMRNINTPPETAKDSIVHAARALQTGDWRLCLKSVVNLNVWSKMPQKDYETIKSMLEVGVKEAGLRTFLLAFASCYETISLDQLIERFDMKSEKVYQIVSSMIYSASMVTEHNASQRFDERTLLHPQLRASWDDRCAFNDVASYVFCFYALTDSSAAKCLVMHRSDPTRLQQHALLMCERIDTAVRLMGHMEDGLSRDNLGRGRNPRGQPRPAQGQGQGQGQKEGYTQNRLSSSGSFSRPFMVRIICLFSFVFYVLLPDSHFLIFCAEAVILLLESHNFSHQSFFNKSISTQT